MRTPPLVLIALAMSLAALTAGCEPGLTTYWTEAQANAACGNDEVVYGLFDGKAGNWGYVRRTSPSWGQESMHWWQYACLAEMKRNHVACMGGNPEAPKPASIAPYCYDEIKKPGA
jgi:hypothetical protein